MVGDAVFNKARVIVTLGNRAIHSHRPIAAGDAQVAVKELFQVCYRLAHTYARGAKPSPGMPFIEHLTAQGFMDPALLYESPFTDINPKGPEGLFELPQVEELISILERIRARATG